MRKILASLIVFMLLGMFSGAVFAGQVDVCEDIKSDPAYKGLYGLCNAYWNADSDEARESILKAFKKKADPLGLTMPGLASMTCPCWDGLTDEQVCAMGDAYYTSFGEGFGGILYLTYIGSGVSHDLAAFGAHCSHVMYEDGKDPAYLEFRVDLLPAEAIDCIAELEVMAMPDFCDL